MPSYSGLSVCPPTSQPDCRVDDEEREAPLILVVDDDDAVRELAATILQDAGYRVLEAESGQRAIQLFEAHPDIGLIFTDIAMPGLDGFKLADIAKFRRPATRI